MSLKVSPVPVSCTRALLFPHLPALLQQGMAGCRRRQESCESREGEEAGGFILQRHPLNWTGEPLPCRMGPGCNLESRQSAPEGPVLHSAAANSCKGLRTHNDQARITPYKNKSIQKRFFPKSNSTIFICCCRIRKVRFRSTPPNSPVTLGGMVPCLSHGL